VRSFGHERFGYVKILRKYLYQSNMPLTSRKVVTQEEPAPQEAPQEAPSSSAQGSALKVKKQRTAKQLAADERSRQRMKERWAKIKAEQAAAGHPAEPKPDDKVPSQPVSEMPKSEPIDPEQVAAKRGRGRPPKTAFDPSELEERLMQRMDETLSKFMEAQKPKEEAEKPKEPEKPKEEPTEKPKEPEKFKPDPKPLEKQTPTQRAQSKYSQWF
jgi:hypothetical protein